MGGCVASETHEDDGMCGCRPGGNNERPVILGFGNPTVDVSVTISSAELDAVGLRPGTETAGESQQTKQQIVDVAMALPAVRRETTPGGSALNTMRVAAWTAGSSIRVVFVGSVGIDDHAEVLLSAMAAVGVEPLLLRAPELPTGLCASLVEADSKDRTLSVVSLTSEHITFSCCQCNGIADTVQFQTRYISQRSARDRYVGRLLPSLQSF